MASGIENALKEAVDMGQVQSRVTLWLVVLVAIMCLLFALRWIAGDVEKVDSANFA
ncbi:hypothetical protein GGU11DRAFT_751845 [Lentinula aff. detonsa]|nr:hypothetical protein GGU11DRAFT_751845 [Lentinula aff. detonsa]KAJ3978285.1 hypothetical protein F5890DRAFT_1560638 [Lentinula detonsa]